MDLSKLRQGIAELAPNDVRQSKRAHVAAMVAEIDDALQRGITLEQIRSYLDGHGFEIGLTTLRQYVAAARAAKGPKLRKAKPQRSSNAPAMKPRQSAAKPATATPGTDAARFIQVPDEEL